MNRSLRIPAIILGAAFAVAAFFVFTGAGPSVQAQGGNAECGGNMPSCNPPGHLEFYETWDGPFLTMCAYCAFPPSCSDYGLLGTYPDCYATPPPPPPPTCADSGQLGTYPNCYTPPPPPTCADYGQLGTYPNCYNQPTCADYGQLGTYPNCYAAPVCVWNHGYSCSSPANACGGTSSGSVQCDGSCSATSAPAPVDACPSTAGLQCSASECAAAAPVASLSASPTSITTGGSSTLTYSCGGSVTSASISGIGAVSPASGGTRSVSPSSTTTYTLSCTGPGGTTTGSATVTVNAVAAQPNLTAGSISPTTATAGSNVTFSASVTNNGGASTGASFPNIFQIQGSSVLAASTISALAAGGSANATYTLANAPAGTYVARLCADNSTSWAGSIAESNEGDNCGPWTSITVSAGAAAPNANLSAAPSTIASGDSSTLTWSSSNATSCTGGGFSTGGATSGNRSVSPGSTATYTLQCTGPGGSDTDTATVTVSGGGGGSCTGAGPVDITASPNRVQPGSATTVTWTGSNVASASCSVTNVNTGASVGNSAVTTCGTSGSASIPSVTAQTTFRLTCGSLVKDVIVNVVPKFEEF